MLINTSINTQFKFKGTDCRCIWPCSVRSLNEILKDKQLTNSWMLSPRKVNISGKIFIKIYIKLVIHLRWLVVHNFNIIAYKYILSLSTSWGLICYLCLIYWGCEYTCQALLSKQILMHNHLHQIILDKILQLCKNTLTQIRSRWSCILVKQTSILLI